MDAESTVLVTRDATRFVETLTINRPQKRGALSFATLRELLRELRRLQDDEQTRVLVLKGSGGSFCAGMDLREATRAPALPNEALREFNLASFPQEDRPTPVYAAIPRLVQDVLLRLKRLPQIVVGFAEGAAFGGGAGILSACDYVIATTNFSFGFSEIKLGFSPDLLFPFLTKQFPIAKLRALVLASRIGAAREAFE